MSASSYSLTTGFRRVVDRATGSRPRLNRGCRSRIDLLKKLGNVPPVPEFPDGRSEMDDLSTSWSFFQWLWELLQRPDFILCFVIGAELIYQIRHDRRVDEREARRLEQEEMNLRKERGYRLLAIWYKQIGGGFTDFWLKTFEERHPEVKDEPNTKGLAIFADWNVVTYMAKSFQELRPQYAELLEFEAANLIISHDWTSLNRGVGSQQLADWDWGVEKLEEVRLRAIQPVTICFHGLMGTLMETWKPAPYDLTALVDNQVKEN
jgi:hypothetical protein